MTLSIVLWITSKMLDFKTGINSSKPLKWDFCTLSLFQKSLILTSLRINLFFTFLGSFQKKKFRNYCACAFIQNSIQIIRKWFRIIEGVIHSHPKVCGYGFWVWVYTQNPYPKTQIFGVYTQNPNPNNPK